MRLKTGYLILCVLGVLLPYWQLAPWVAEHGLDLPLLFRQLFANRAGAFFGMDVFVSAAALSVFAWTERSRVRALWPVALAVVAVGVSLGLPLLLYLRERHARRSV